jgi:hypothetical protein
MTVPDHKFTGMDKAGRIVAGIKPPPDPMRMLVNIDSRLTAIEQNLLTVLKMLDEIRPRVVEHDNGPMEESRALGEKLARAIREVSR